MRKESVNPPLPNLWSWIKIWGAALLRPTQAGYARTFGALQPHRATAMAWLVTSAIVAAIINMITYLAAPAEFLLVALCVAMPLFTFLYVALTILTTRGALWITAQMDSTFDRSAPFDRLFTALAAINSPMFILQALAYLLPSGYLVAYALALYWLFLTVLAIKTLVGVSWGRAVAASAVFILAMALVAVLSVGAAFLPPVP